MGHLRDTERSIIQSVCGEEFKRPLFRGFSLRAFRVGGVCIDDEPWDS